MAVLSCRHFNGYKPCSKNSTCDVNCPSVDPVYEHVLLIHLGALGAVVRSTSLLKAIKRKHPHSHLTWVTEKSAVPLIQNHPLIDQVLAADFEGLLTLRNYRFSTAYIVDKSAKASGLAKSVEAWSLQGFVAHQHYILPASTAAEELWNIGLDDEMKFRGNKKTEAQLVAEALNLEYRRDDYDLPLTALEKKLSQVRSWKWSEGGQKLIVGLNTGCSPVIPYKKLTVDFHRELIRQLGSRDDLQVVLLGGPEDTVRNLDIARDLNVVSSPTQGGLRDGLVSVSACDLVVTGDSLGMHMAIAQKKWVVAWFGPTCAHEIDLYGRGVAVLSKAPCGPCWKRSCQKDLMCYDQVELSEILAGVEKGIQFWQRTSSYKPPFSEMSY